MAELGTNLSLKCPTLTTFANTHFLLMKTYTLTLTLFAIAMVSMIDPQSNKITHSDNEWLGDSTLETTQPEQVKVINDKSESLNKSTLEYKISSNNIKTKDTEDVKIIKDTEETKKEDNKETSLASLAPNTPKKPVKVINIDYWDTVYSIESKQGKLLYRPKNKSRNCTYTTSPCGHHQLTVQALQDIGCNTIQCRKDRLNYTKSLAMSKQFLIKNEKRLKKNGYENLEDYQKYLIHQQGANGIKVILEATKGKKTLNKTIKRNMANNSPYSYQELSRMGSRLAARVFLNHWKNKWEQEKQLIIAKIAPASKHASYQTSGQISVEQTSLPLFNETEIQLALNYTF